MTDSESIYSKCDKLLGEAQEPFSRLKDLCQSLGEEKKLVHENESVKSYYLTTSGVELVYSKRRECFIAALFFINTGHITEGKMERYDDLLLNGVTCGDSIDDVENKVGPPASRGHLPEEATLRYRFSNREVSFYFDGSGERLKGVLVKFSRPKAAE